MTYEGVDYSWGRPDPYEMADLGIAFAARYLSYDTTGKNLTAGELERLVDAGISVVANWEYAAGDALGGYNAGRSHAIEAFEQAQALGMPEGRPIYFSVDFDMQSSQVAAVRDYFNGVASVVDRCQVGIYGGYNTIKRAFDEGWCEWFWQTYAWSYGNIHDCVHFRQYQNGVTLAGATVDLNEAYQDDIGQWGVDVSAKDVWYSDGMVPAPRPPVNNSDYFNADGSEGNTLWTARWALADTCEKVRYVQADTKAILDKLNAHTTPDPCASRSVDMKVALIGLVIVLVAQLGVVAAIVWMGQQS